MSCKVCSDFQSWSHGGVQQQGSKPNDTKSTGTNQSDKTNATTTTTEPSPTPVPQSNYKIECPPGYKELANSTWSFLHTTAAYFPSKPSTEEKRAMSDLLKSVSLLYPCQPCAEHMRESIKISPPKVDSQTSVSLWLCDFHNQVNQLLGKPKFDCSRTDERWRDGPKDGSC